MTSEASRLSRIDTPWSVLRRAREGSDGSIQWARQALLERYGGPVRRYLRAVLRNEEADAEVFQEFALRLARGDFCSADPERGRFRNFVKTALHNLIVDFRKKAARGQKHSLDELSALPVEEGAAQPDLFLQSWSQELLDRSWARLREVESGGNTPYYSALRLLVDESGLTSEAMAAQLSVRLGREFTPGNVRVVVHRARQMFAHQLVTEVADSLETGGADEIEQELGDLNLLEYCRSAMARRREHDIAAVSSQEAAGS